MGDKLWFTTCSRNVTIQAFFYCSLNFVACALKDRGVLQKDYSIDLAITKDAWCNACYKRFIG